MLPTPIKTARASEWLMSQDATKNRLQAALLSNVDGHRNVVELESFARALGLEPEAIDCLRRQDFIQLLS